MNIHLFSHLIILSFCIAFTFLSLELTISDQINFAKNLKRDLSCKIFLSIIQFTTTALWVYFYYLAHK